MEEILSQAKKVAEQAEVFQVSSISTPVHFEANRLKQLQSKQQTSVAAHARLETCRRRCRQAGPLGDAYLDPPCLASAILAGPSARRSSSRCRGPGGLARNGPAQDGTSQQRCDCTAYRATFGLGAREPPSCSVLPSASRP